MKCTKIILKNSISFAIICLSASSFIGFTDANAMLFTKEFTRSSVTKKFIRNPTIKKGLIYNKARDHYYSVEQDESLNLVEGGRPIRKNEISQKDVMHKCKTEKNLEGVYSYKMPVYEINKNEKINSKLSPSIENIKTVISDEMGVGDNDANASLYLTGAKLNAVINKEDPINAVYCPMGVTQTLALLSAIAENPIREEIQKFSQNPRIVEDMTILNKLIQNSDKSCLANKGDDKRFDFTNGVYALLASSLKFNKPMAEPLEAIGAQILEIDFSNSSAAAAKLNAIVEKDTKGKIKTLLTAEAFSPDSAFVLLHTLYLNASWAFGGVEESYLKFMDLNKRRKYVKYLTLNGTHLRYMQNEEATIVILPTVGGCHLTLRHSTNIRDVKPLEASEISYLINSPAQYLRTLHAPFVTMNESLNLKTLLNGYLPQILHGSFKTILTNDPIKIADYIQKITFDMTNKGVEASSATALHGCRESASMYKNGPIININSPFSFALTRSLDGKDYLLFQGQVVYHDVLVSEKKLQVTGNNF